ncbi:uncharacterized protein At4g15970-like [Macadamia integrifolia]|uniref:uncharacterized protein At4g15970-like n=1 Tax=Macadamia integrifolia TaxID=60698 RepID=UPI001C4E3873|nr:uncharacterized protein At4g15970-like [Macadamia integrifolia]
MKLESGRGETGGCCYSGNLRRWVLIVTLVFTAIAVPCLVLNNTVYPFLLLRHSSYSMENGKGKLGRVLKEAAMEDNTVIITTLNEAWATPGSIFDLFLESFLIGNQTKHLLDHLVVVALDQKAYNSCLAVHSHCFALTTKDVDFSGQEKYFMSPDYLKMMWRRIHFLRSVLQLGYNFVFTDADIMWFRDPFPRLYKDADFQISCDRFNGNSLDSNNAPNGGFTYVKSNKRTMKFYKFWYLSKNTHPGLHDQDVFNMIKHHPFITLIGLKMRFLSTTYFGGFCETSKDLNQVCTMHANCCAGLDRKVHDLKVMLEDWRTYVSQPTAVKRSNSLSWRVPQLCWETFHQRPLKRKVPKEKKG